MTIPFDTLRRKWMKDPKFRAEYERIGPEMELAMTLAEGRRKAGLTQTELAARMKTSQAEVARVESGHGAPKWSTIERYAHAIGARPVVHLLNATGQTSRPASIRRETPRKAAARGPKQGKRA
jgi:transcriptional regulator with XRE-family HTH domain